MANKDKSPRAPRTARTTATPTDDDAPRTAYTTFVLFPDQLMAIKQAALRMQAGEGGRADQSEVLRQALDAMASGAELPHGLKEALAAGVRERRQAARSGSKS